MIYYVSGMGGVKMKDDLKEISVLHIFDEENYLVPIYQRNYAWKETQIVQLIEDIESSKSNYFLGNLIVNQRDNNVYEVIDGQQRLTTLYLLEKYLGIILRKEAFRFEAREISNHTLSYLTDSKHESIEKLIRAENLEDLSAEILNGFKIIENYFKMKNIDKKKFIKKLEQVFLIKIQVPKDIDLNHYFEIMNTRGEQLEVHEIAKAKLLEVLEDDDRKVASLIWGKCSDMSLYVQMQFDVNIRNSIFNKDWSDLSESIENFDSIKKEISIDEKQSGKKSLIDILKSNELPSNSQSEYESENENENERFESILSFSDFLLQVNAVMREYEEEDVSLDDKEFLKSLSWIWLANEEEKAKENAKDFLFHLLKCRVLFDKYILKREFTKDYKNSGRWSLQALKKDDHIAKYKATLGNEGDNKRLRSLQSCLRITYTSAKTMHWITLVLSDLLKNEKTEIINTLEDYCRGKVIESDFENSSGFGFKGIVFTYLDYLIYRDGYSYKGEKIISAMQEDWQFQFRNSIEHFYPQHPFGGEVWEYENLNGFGNLALITVSGNSRLSNLFPDRKIEIDENIIKQSLKLKIMVKITSMGNGKWTKDKSDDHKEKMFDIFRNDISYLKSKGERSRL